MSITRNADGSAIFTLSAPIKWHGDDLDKVTIPAMRGKHLRMCPVNVNSPEVTLGVLVDFAAKVVMPLGCVDEMTPEDAVAVAVEVGSALGKGRQTGVPVSP